MQNKLTFGSGYSWNRYQSNYQAVSQIQMSNSILYASDFVITRNGSTFSYLLTSPSSLSISQSSWNRFTQSTSSSYSTVTVTLTSGNRPTLQSGTETRLTVSGTTAVVRLAGTSRDFALDISSSYINTTRSNIESIAGRYVIIPGDSNVYKLPTIINSSNLVINADSAGNGTIRFSELQKVTASYVDSVTSYDSTSYPSAEWLDNYFYSRQVTGSSSESIKDKYFTVGSTMYYCSSDNVQDSTTQTWTFTNAKQYTPVTQTTDVYSPTESTYPENGYLTPYYYILSGEPFELGDESIYGGVNYEQVVNTEDDIELGCTAGACISFQVETSNNISIGQSLIYSVKQEHDSQYRTIGKFFVSSIKKGKTRYTVTAYDSISKFDKVVDEWLNNLTFPISARSMLTSLCNYCGVSTDSSVFINSNVQLQDNFESINLTGRYVLSYIAQLGAGFARCTPQGILLIKTLGFETNTLNNSKYTTLFQEDYTVQPVNTVRIAYDDDPGTIAVEKPDIPVANPNTLGIYGNPLLYFDETTLSTIEGCATNILNQLSSHSSYTPMLIECLEDFNINAGSSITIGDKTTYVFRKAWTSSGVEFESTGNEYRKAANVNKDFEINALRGKVHNLDISVEGISSQVTDASIKANKSLTWTAAEGLVIQDETTGGHVLITGNDINVPTINAKYLNMLGCIKFDDFDTTDTKTAKWLETSGQIYRQNTVPSGTGIVVGAMWYCTANIGTTYTANTWYSYDGTNWTQTSNPYYVKSTYIDRAEIRSPLITGNNIIVNSDRGGSFQLQRDGINVGFMGRGTSYNSSSQLIEGVVVANNTDGEGTQLSAGDNYLACNPSQVELAYSKAIENQDHTISYRLMRIYINSNGAFYNDGNGNVQEIGYARFG